MAGSSLAPLGLPTPEPPFPVVAPYRVAPDLYRLGTVVHGRLERGHFALDSTYPAYLERKLDLLGEREPACRVLDAGADEAGLAEALWRVLAVLAGEHPALVGTTEDGVALRALGLRLRASTAAERVCPRLEALEGPLLPGLGGRAAAWLEGRRGLARLADALALACQEDYAIMSGNGETHRAELLHVCFPSGWDPREKTGRDFGAIHEPVAENRPLLAAGRNVMAALLAKGPFVRFAWGLTLDSSLDQFPGRPRPALDVADPEAVAASTFLRVERQTTLPLPDLGRGLFTIRVYVQPLTEAASDPERRAVLARALRSMSPAVLEYKGLAGLRDPLLAWLERA